jgi:hypothetical protein
MKRLAVLCVVAIVAACSEPGPPPAPEVPPTDAVGADTLTATGWGALQIGMTRAAVIAAAGEDANPGAVGGADPEQCDEFHPANAPEGMLVMIENGVLTRISLVREATLRTAGGVGVGDTSEAVLSAYPGAVTSAHKYVAAPAAYITTWQTGSAADADYVQDPDARGLVFEIDETGLVTAIRAGGPSIQYVEGCS